MNNKAHRLAWLDGCRALAALLVICMHVTEIWIPFISADDAIGQGLRAMTHQFNLGTFGVYVFFLVSGFVIPFSVRGEGLAACRTFLIRRFFRLMPMFWFSIPLGVVTTHWMWHKDFGWDALLANVLLLPNLFDLPFAQGLYWSLQAEVTFYLLIAALLLVQGFARSSIVLPYLGVIAAGKLLEKSGLQAYHFYPVAMLVLEMLKIIFIGWLLQRLFSDRRLGKMDWLLLGYLLVQYFIKKPLNAWHFYQHGERWLDHLSVTLAIVVLLFFRSLDIRHSLLAYLGKISYSLYLLHPVIMYSALYHVAVTPDSFLREWPLLWVLVGVLLLTVAASHLTWRFIELPAQQWGKKLIASQPAPDAEARIQLVKQ